MSEISGNLFVPLPPGLYLTQTIININPKSPQTEYYQKIIDTTMTQVNEIYYVRNVNNPK